MRARSSRAPAPVRTANRAPAIFAARSKSRMPRASPISQWLLAGVRQCGRGSPPRVSLLSLASFPIGTDDMWKIWDAEIQIGKGFFNIP